MLFSKMVTDAMLPKDILLRCASLTMIGPYELRIENYKGLLEYSAAKIKVMTAKGPIEISGCKLEITYYAKEEMKITGIIDQISYQKRKGAPVER